MFGNPGYTPAIYKWFFVYLKGNILPSTRLAYLQDIRFFCNYLINETDLTEAENPRDIKLEEFAKIEAADVNVFIDYCRKYKWKREM